MNILFLFILSFHSANFDPKYFHNGLRTFDNGIVSMYDLKKGDEIGFSDKKDIMEMESYPFWYCFPSDKIEIECEHRTYDDEKREYRSSFKIVGIDGNKFHTYYLVHGQDDETCQWFLGQALERMKNEKLICVSGNQPLLERENGRDIYYWNFRRLKTRLGYFHYALEDRNGVPSY